MKIRTCECGYTARLGSASVPPCVVCEKCGTTLALEGVKRREPVKHEPVHETITTNGKRIDKSPYCARCGKPLGIKTT